MRVRVVFLLGVGAAALALAACDAGPSATSKSASASPTVGGTGVTAASAVDPRDAPIPLVDGKPMWAPNKKHTAQENADYQFAKNGKDFGAASEADYVARAHAFVDAPPTDAQKLTRSNGDELLYDGKTNTFAVVTKDGAPRTMFKPRDGANYWREQVQREQAKSKNDGGDSSES